METKNHDATAQSQTSSRRSYEYEAVLSTLNDMESRMRAILGDKRLVRDAHFESVMGYTKEFYEKITSLVLATVKQIDEENEALVSLLAAHKRQNSQNDSSK